MYDKVSKRRFLKLEERVNVIKLNDGIKSGRAIAEKIGVGRERVR